MADPEGRSENPILDLNDDRRRFINKVSVFSLENFRTSRPFPLPCKALSTKYPPAP